MIMGSIALILCAGTAEAQERTPLKLIKTVPLPGVKGRFDHFTIDAKRNRLFVAGLGNNTLEILDVAAGKHLRSITGLHKPTGVVYLPDQDQIAVANGDDGTLKVFEGKSYGLVKTINSLPDADNVRFHAKAKLIYVGYGHGALAVIDATTMKQTHSIKLAAHLESFQLEREGNRIFVNVPGANEIAVIDRSKGRVINEWRYVKFGGNFPMALDETRHRLFVGCRKPASSFAIDTTTGKLAWASLISGDTDDLFYDEKMKRLYISCGEGFVDVIEHEESGDYRLPERIPTRGGARTSFFAAALNQYYLAVPQKGNRMAEIRIFQPQK